MNDKNRSTAQTAIKRLSEAVRQRKAHLILAAYQLVEADTFSWDGLDDLAEKWDALVERGNDIVYSHG